jgi:hypothetical protein
MSLTRIQVQRATTVSPWTRDFRHLLPVPKHFQNRQTWFDPITKAVRVKDRIKYWNVVPGDQICIRGDTRKIIHEVLSINKFTNRVYLKGANLVRGLLYCWYSSVLTEWFCSMRGRNTRPRSTAVCTTQGACSTLVKNWERSPQLVSSLSRFRKCLHLSASLTLIACCPQCVCETYWCARSSLGSHSLPLELEACGARY